MTIIATREDGSVVVVERHVSEERALAKIARFVEMERVALSNLGRVVYSVKGA